MSRGGSGVGAPRRLRAAAMLCVLGLVVGAPASAQASQHEVLPGESLASIALQALGDASLWPAIYLANRDQIKEPSRVYPGQVLTIPEVPAAEREAVRREARALSARRQEPAPPQAE